MTVELTMKNNPWTVSGVPRVGGVMFTIVSP